MKDKLMFFALSFFIIMTLMLMLIIINTHIFAAVIFLAFFS